ncbi:MAG: TIM barrel protein [Phyllobacteriaceae bacterium]|nr:TIM barrel protein [Phyllobacteriaceae bacterium]
MPLIAANTGFLWKDLPFLERIRRAKVAGFTAVEFHDEAQSADLGTLLEVLAETGLPVLGLNTRMGPTMGAAALVGHEAQARADIDDAVRIAKAVGARAIHVVAGKAEGPEAHAAYLGSLIHALDRFDGTILIEPISMSAVPGYFLGSLYQAADIADTLDNPRLKLLFDVFHVRAMGYDLVQMANEFMPFIGHVQLAGWPERDEPVLAASMAGMLKALGYGGDFGAEYRPRGVVEDGLGWLAEMRAT